MNTCTVTTPKELETSSASHIQPKYRIQSSYFPKETDDGENSSDDDDEQTKFLSLPTWNVTTSSGRSHLATRTTTAATTPILTIDASSSTSSSAAAVEKSSSSSSSSPPLTTALQDLLGLSQAIHTTTSQKSTSPIQTASTTTLVTTPPSNPFLVTTNKPSTFCPVDRGTTVTSNTATAVTTMDTKDQRHHVCSGKCVSFLLGYPKKMTPNAKFFETYFPNNQTPYKTTVEELSRRVEYLETQLRAQLLVLQQTRYYTPENTLYLSTGKCYPSDTATTTTNPFQSNESHLHGTMTQLFQSESPESNIIIAPSLCSPVSSTINEMESYCKIQKGTREDTYCSQEEEDEEEEEVPILDGKHHERIPSLSFLMNQSKELRGKKAFWEEERLPKDDVEDENDDDTDSDDEELLRIEVRQRKHQTLFSVISSSAV